MESTGVLDEALGSRVKLRLLRKIAEQEAPKSGRQIAREIGCSPNHTIESLRELEGLGILRRRQVGRASTYELKRGSYLVDRVVEPILEAEREMIPMVIKRFTDAAGEDLVRAVLFGSVARGDAGPFSDIDLLLVVDDEAPAEEIDDRVNQAVVDALAEFGRRCDVFVITDGEYGRRLSEGQGMWAAVREEGVELGRGAGGRQTV
jgi:predicted nucleotidyltransferase/biotin operon repressor